MKSSVRKTAVLLIAILDVLASFLWVSRACVRDYSQELYESISDSTAQIRAMLPERNVTEKRYIAALNRINRAKLNGVCLSGKQIAIYENAQ